MLLRLAYQHVLFAAKVCMCYTEQQQESSVLATINLEKNKNEKHLMSRIHY